MGAESGGFRWALCNHCFNSLYVKAENLGGGYRSCALLKKNNILRQGLYKTFEVQQVQKVK